MIQLMCEVIKMPIDSAVSLAILFVFFLGLLAFI
jgi:hypothetical protein